MLIRVEVYADDSGTVSKTIHACLATCNDDDGTLFAMGRKAGDVTFPLDKSVSRQHCLVRCVGDGNQNGCAAPRNDQERAACLQSNNGMCLVLENMGKGGTYVAVPDIPIPATTTNDDSDSATDAGDNSETDDEGISQPPKSQKSRSTLATANSEDIPPLSQATKRFWNRQKAKLLKMDVGDHHLLPFDFDDKSILVQCGRFESTIQMTWIPLRVSFSRLPKSSPLPSKLYLTGAVEDDLPDAQTTTHLVTPERMGGAKQLIAWCLDIPMVPPAYLEAFVARTSSSDPLPDISDYPIAVKDKFHFWEKQPNSTLLSHYTLLSVESNELERLAVAAGATLVALYENDDDDANALQRAKDVLESSSDTCCFTIASRKRLGKQLLQLGVASVSAKKLASAVSKQEGELQDSNGNPIAAVQKRTTDTTKKEEKEAEHHDDNVGDGTQPSPPRRESKRKRTQQQSTVEEKEPPKRKRSTIEDTNTTESEAPPETTPSLSLPPPSSKEESEPILSEPHEEASSPPEEDTTTHDEDMEEVPPPPPPPQEEEDHTSEKKLAPKKTTRPPATMSRSAASTKPSSSSRQTTSSKSQLGGVDSNGWFVTAPKEDGTRNEWRTRNDNAEVDSGGMPFLPAAHTETIALVTPPAATSTTSTTTTARRRGGPDFKRFRKNSIRRVEETDRITIALRAVLPKESEHQQQMDVHHKQLEEEQRRADELFRGDGGTGGGRKRRRALV